MKCDYFVAIKMNNSWNSVRTSWVRARERRRGLEHFCGFQIMIFVCGRWPLAATEILRKKTNANVNWLISMYVCECDPKSPTHCLFNLVSESPTNWFTIMTAQCMSNKLYPISLIQKGEMRASTQNSACEKRQQRKIELPRNHVPNYATGNGLQTTANNINCIFIHRLTIGCLYRPVWREFGNLIRASFIDSDVFH